VSERDDFVLLLVSIMPICFVCYDRMEVTFAVCKSTPVIIFFGLCVWNEAVFDLICTLLSLNESGMSKEQWRKMKEAEKKKGKSKNLGQTGITSFKSRSFADWQKSGGKNLFPVDPRSVKDASQLPYMQRPGGMPDDSDLKKPKGGFSFFGKKPAPKKEPEPEPEKKTNWWNLS